MDNLFSADRRVIDLNSKDMFSYESFNTIQKMAELDEKTNSVKNAILIDLDSVSRNGSMYAAEAVMQSLDSPYIQESFKRGVMFGELEHPEADCTRERFMKVKHENICHRNINYRREGNHIKGDVQYVAPKGPIAWDWIKKGSNMAWSIRILTPNYEERKDPNGNPYIYKFGSMRMVAWDQVLMPGYYDASLVDPNVYDASKESFDGIKSVKWTAGRKKEEFMRLLNSQESLPILEDIYGFSMSDVKNISYSSEGLITLGIKANIHHSKSIKIPTNTYKINQILCAGRSEESFSSIQSREVLGFSEAEKFGKANMSRIMADHGKVKKILNPLLTSSIPSALSQKGLIKNYKGRGTIGFSTDSEFYKAQVKRWTKTFKIEPSNDINGCYEIPIYVELLNNNSEKYNEKISDILPGYADGKYDEEKVASYFKHKLSEYDKVIKSVLKTQSGLVGFGEPEFSYDDDIFSIIYNVYMRASFSREKK